MKRRSAFDGLLAYAFALMLAGAVTSGVERRSSGVEDRVVSSLKSDERIVFFTTDARRSADGRSWIVPIHAWVHEREVTRARKAVFAAILKKKYGLAASADTAANFDARVGLFVVDNERGKDIVIRLAGQTFALPPTGANGHTSTEIELAADAVAEAATEDALAYAAVLPDGDGRRFAGRVNLVEPDGISVISDIDDTVKLTGVTDRAVMFDRTFFRAFEPAPGMPALYTRWARSRVSFHFVSSSPWHLYEPIDDFMTASGFPPRSVSLKQVRVKDSSILDLFRKGTETKPRQIEPILARFPRRRFVLVGDSGEQDPEVYAALMERYPDRIERIYIRNVDESTRDDDRYRRVFAEIDPTRWELFADPARLGPI